MNSVQARIVVPAVQALVAILALLLACCGSRSLAAEGARSPNVVLIMTDDQGWGDVGFHGNPHLKTPHLDRLAQQSVELTRFYVCPVCSPTRASLMTGRYNYRTGAIDTFMGRSTMVADEVTLAEMFAAAGYRTGIFGKWHLGDNYPSRPIDQGFSESLVHRGGGIGQPSDPPGNTYFDPALLHNGRDVESTGYCSDVFTDAAIDFMAGNADKPFFIYLPFNCPHTPLQVPKAYHDRYRNKSLNEAAERVYGMVANIDDNLGRLFAKMSELGLDEQTIVIFLTDNGPQQPGRFNGVLRGLKTTVYEGGIHVPCLIRWPGHLEGGSKVDALAAHIDLAPTLLDACGIERPTDVEFDGVSLWPLLQKKQQALPERLLFFQWHRGDKPQKYRAFAVRGPRFKLLQPEGNFESQFEPSWELYDLIADPSERNNLIDVHPDEAARLKCAYEDWLADVSGTRGYPVPRIIVGTDRENPVTLTRQDWRGEGATWNAKGVGHWHVEVPVAGRYDITVRVPSVEVKRAVELSVGDDTWSEPMPGGNRSVTFKDLQLPAGTLRVQAIVGDGEKSAGAHYIDLRAHSVVAARP